MNKQSRWSVYSKPGMFSAAIWTVCRWWHEHVI